MSSFEQLPQPGPAKENLSVVDSPLHGDGVVSTRTITAGTVIFKERPLCFLQTLPNTQDVIVCGDCQRFLGSMDTQVGVLSKALSRQSLVTECSPSLPFQCKDKCGEFYCSETCRDSHWRRHRMLCTGALSEEDAESSPLFQFKVHACQTNSIFLLVADVFARICDDVERMRSEGSLDETAIISRALEPYSRFVRNLWWDAVSAESESLNEVGMDGTREKDDLAGTLKLLVHDSWELLRKALDLDRRGLTDVLSTEYFSRTIGMFEQNNIGVRCAHPIAHAISGLTPHKDSALTRKILEGAEKIAHHLDENQMCDDNDGEGEGEWEDCDEDDDEDMENESDNSEAVEAHGPTGDEDLDKLKEVLTERGVQAVFPDLDGTALYTVMCKVNHSCAPNVIVTYECTDGALMATLTAVRDIQPGEELLHSYIDQHMEYEYRLRALLDYGFQCRCLRCTQGAQS